jgi:hypothetical protein
MVKKDMYSYARVGWVHPEGIHPEGIHPEGIPSPLATKL